MVIPVIIKSNINGQVKKGVVSARQLIGFTDESDLIIHFTECDCQPIGETNVIECNCDEPWMDCEVLIGDEIRKGGQNGQT